MKWLQIGFAKSGNLWLYKILQSIAHRAKLEQKSFIQNQPIHAIAKDWALSFPGQADIDTLSINPTQCLYRISGIFNMPIEDMDAYLAQTSHVWTQSYFCEMTDKLLPKFDKVIYIIRDVRDAAISMSRFSFTPYRQRVFTHGMENPREFLNAVLDETAFNWVRHVASHLKHQRRFKIHVVFYERLLEQFEEELTKLLQYLQIDPDPTLMDAVKKDVAFEAMQDKNPQHVRRGEWGAWMNDLNRDEISRFRTFAGPLLRLLNYPLLAIPEQEGGIPLPDLRKDLLSSAWDNILADLRRKTILRRAVQSLKTFLIPLKDGSGPRPDPVETE